MGREAFDEQNASAHIRWCSVGKGTRENEARKKKQSPTCTYTQSFPPSPHVCPIAALKMS